MFKGIVLHWTAGNYYPSEYDKKFYHYLIDKDGKVYKGLYQPTDNLNCKDNKYAAHCRGYNTGTIGVAICCRKDEKTQPTEEQIKSMCMLVSNLCKTYKIPIDKVQTHCEISPNRKIDINELPYLSLKGNKTVADYIRQKVRYYDNEKGTDFIQ